MDALEFALILLMVIGFLSLAFMFGAIVWITFLPRVARRELWSALFSRRSS
jgi:hypothetical protein